MAYSTRLTLFWAREEGEKSRSVYTCEPSYWKEREVRAMPGMEEVQIHDGFQDWIGTFAPQEVLRLEQEYWQTSFEAKYPGAYTVATETHEKLVKFLTPPSPVAEVQVRVFEWESGLSD